AWDIIIDIVLKGSKNCTLSCGKYWIENKIEANVLNIVTTYASTGSGFVVPSATAKAGVLAMTRSLAVEWAKYGMRHNAIAPGPFPTKGAWDRLFPKEMSAKVNLENRIPLKRVGEHQELANLAAYLMSDYSAYINGEVVTIDGGEWLQGAGQFNQMEAITKEEWDFLEKIVRANQKKS
ncbi:MAG: SDR family oxidoreductase, partial [Bacteroidia bacterium]|nr:SDR family oxidoreductase [Bacteroidia bacterium]